MMDGLKSLLKAKLRELKREFVKLDGLYGDEIQALDKMINHLGSFQQEDYNYIVSLLNEIEQTEETKETIIGKLQLLLFVNNSDPGLEISFTEEEMQAIIKTIDNIKSDLVNLKNSHNANAEDYKREINYIEDINNKIADVEYIDNLDYILKLTEGLDKEQKLAVLESLFDYNHQIRVETQDEIETYESNYDIDRLPDRFDEETLGLLLSKYGYDINLITSDHINVLKKRGNLDRIEEVLETLKARNIFMDMTPANEKNAGENELAFVKLILNGDRETMEKSFRLAENYGLEDRDLLGLVASLIKQRRYTENSNSEFPQSESESLYAGSATNFEKNIELFSRELFDSKHGWDLSKIFSRSKFILVQPYKSVKKKFDLFKEYHIEFYYDEKQALTSLISPDLGYKLDRYIEINKDAAYYITHNLSRLVDSDQLIYKLLYFSKNKYLGIDPYYRKDSTRPSSRLKGYMTDLDKLDIRNDISSDDKAIIRKILTASKKDLRNLMGIVDLTTLPNYDLYAEVLNDENKGNYISDNIYLRPEINNLERNYNDSSDYLVYNINGGRISRYKVLRVYQALIDKFGENLDDSALLFAMTYQSLLDDVQLKNIKETISNKSKVI